MDTNKTLPVDAMENPEALFLASDDARMLLACRDGASLSLSLDLHRTSCQVVIGPDGLSLPGGWTVSREQLQAMARRRKRIYLLQPQRIEALEVVSDHYYKLSPTSGAPTIEIDGIQMHRTKGIDPFEDSRLKAVGAVRRDDVVLDTCGGLGYTAIWAARRGAARVISVELSQAVCDLRAKNPWSRDLFGPPIELVHDDVADTVRRAPDSFFDSVIHDPPRFSLAGELYGAAFYAGLSRLIRPGGRCFHYTGAPYGDRGLRDFPQEVQKRMRQAGFRTRYDPAAMGILAHRED